MYKSLYEKHVVLNLKNKIKNKRLFLILLATNYTNPNLSCIQTLKGHEGFVWSIIQLNDNNIASCSADKTINLWDLKTNQCIQTLKGHKESVWSIIQLNDGNIASCSDDETIKLWD